MATKLSVLFSRPWFFTRGFYLRNSCCLSMDRDICIDPCTDTPIIVQLPCYSGQYMAFSTYIMGFEWYVYNLSFS